ncbi:C4 protein [Pedilanthus leaf curl virus-[Cestrum nocturnum]]|nr:C4 protein [Pedilanthus leaf curl virus-[Crape Jasmine]]AGI60334.1 C4 protein [Pedilanthus leaf curl virus-[Cestrum nocturnum]]
MGLLISTCLSSSKGNTNARITDSSTWFPQPGQHISIRTFRELNQVPMSSPIWRRTETPLIGESFRSTEDLLEGVNSQPTTHTPQQLTQAVNQRLSESLRR